MKALVLIEVVDGGPTDDSLGVLARLSASGMEAWALVAGSDIASAAAQVTFHPCQGVLTAEAPPLASPCPEVFARFLAGVAREQDFELVAFAASVVSTELAARLAIHTEAGLLWGLTEIQLDEGRLVGVRSTHGDTMRTASEWHTPIAVGLFRQHECAPAEPRNKPAPVVALAVDSLAKDRLMAVASVGSKLSSAGSSLAAAEIIVSAGRGIGQRENLTLVRDLAEALGGVVGVSLPLVDMGWAPRSLQVGQTGTVVAPRLYIACGVSGQIQHKVGIERSGVIVAINTDSEAPIMKFCDLAIVGDVRTVLPALTDAIRQTRKIVGGPTTEMGGSPSVI